jgi:hypothetical protein
MGFTGGLKEPLAFGLLLGSLGGMVGLFWQFLVFSAGLSPLTEPFFDRFAVGLVFLIILGFIPAVVILAMFLYSGVLHLLLLAVGGGKRGYEATFRVVSYSQAAQAWGLIPFIGGWIGSLWQVIVQIIGLREIHGTSYLRVIIAFLIPLALLLILGITVSIVLLAYLAQQGGNPS